MTLARKFEHPINWKANGVVLRDDNTVGAYAIRIDALERYEAVLRLLVAIIELLWPVRPRLPQVTISWSLPSLSYDQRTRAAIVWIWVRQYLRGGAR